MSTLCNCFRYPLFAALALTGSMAAAQTAVVTTYTSEQSFIAAAGGLVRQVDLEDVPVDTTGAFQSRGVSFYRAPANGTGPVISVVQQFIGGSHINYFGLHGSSPQFLAAGLGFGARLPADQYFAGFTLRSLSCTPGEFSTMNWRLLDAADQTVSTGSAQVNECGPVPNVPTTYFGIQSSVPFRTVEFFRNQGSSFLVDDLATGPVAGAAVRFQDDMPPDRLLAHFDDVPVGQFAPFTSGTITFSNTGPVDNQFAAAGHAVFFAGMASAPNFLNTSFQTSLTAPIDADSLGFVYRSVSNGPSIINLETTGLAGGQSQNLGILAASHGPASITIRGLPLYRSARVRGLETETGFINVLIDDVKVARIGLFADGMEGN